MIGKRIEITGTLEVLSPLQIGSGKRQEFLHDDGETASLRLVDSDGEGRPFVPGSTLKGVLRALLHGHTDLGAAFGPDAISGPDDAHAGRIIFRNAWFQGLPPAAVSDSVRGRTPAGTHDATFVEAHVGKDADAGVAARARLFHDEVVLPGTTFALSLALLDDDSGLLSFVQQLLGHLSANGGVSFGRAGRQGLGRLRLQPGSVTAERVPGGKLVRLTIPDLAGDAATYRLALVSDVPFQIHDPARPPLPAKDGEAQRGNTLLALKALGSDGARLTGSSLMGALRAAYADFAARKKAAGSVDRLFGITGQRGRVRIDAIFARNAGRAKTITSVKLDRFSGAPIDNALFASEGFVGTEYHVDLSVEARGAQTSEDQAADAALFKAFLDSLKDEIFGGLMLGHGSSRGFGWFTVKERAK